MKNTKSFRRISMSENYDIIKIIEMPKNVSDVIPVEIQNYGRDLNVEQLIVP